MERWTPGELGLLFIPIWSDHNERILVPIWCCIKNSARAWDLILLCTFLVFTALLGFLSLQVVAAVLLLSERPTIPPTMPQHVQFPYHRLKKKNPSYRESTRWSEQTEHPPTPQPPSTHAFYWPQDKPLWPKFRGGIDGCRLLRWLADRYLQTLEFYLHGKRTYRFLKENQCRPRRNGDTSITLPHR